MKASLTLLLWSETFILVIFSRIWLCLEERKQWFHQYFVTRIKYRDFVDILYRRHSAGKYLDLVCRRLRSVLGRNDRRSRKHFHSRPRLLSLMLCLHQTALNSHLIVVVTTTIVIVSSSSFDWWRITSHLKNFPKLILIESIEINQKSSY